MKIRLAMLDVDGTLMREAGWMPGARELLAALHARGITVALCSGRAIDSLQVTGSACPEVTYLAGAGGSIVQARDGDGWRTVGERFLAPEVVRTVAARAAALGMEVWAYSHERWYVTERTARVAYDESFTHATATLGGFADRTDVIKMLLFCETPEQEAFRDEVAGWDGIGVASSYPGYDDVLPAESLAGKGGDLLCEALGIGWDEVLAVGDGLNDVGMLSRARLAYALAPRVEADLEPTVGEQERIYGGEIADVLADLRTRALL